MKRRLSTDLDASDGLGSPKLSAKRPRLDTPKGADSLANALMSLQAPEVAVLPLYSVVQVIVVSATPSYVSPWQVKAQESGSGSGFIVDGRRILTNAHVVRDFITVRVKKFGDATRYPARVISIGYDCDCALITVDTDAFWEDVTPVKFARDLPHLYDTVSVIGFPTGGKTICVTKGVVSRVDTMHYNIAYKNSPGALLVVQIDAAINPGNSGGPSFNEEGNVVGIAFLKQIGGTSDNIGYIIPICVVENFLYNVSNNGRYTGFKRLGFTYQSMENKSLRVSSGMEEHQTGVLVTTVAPLSPAHGVIQPNDIITEIDGKTVSNDGSVAFRKHELVNFEHLITGRADGETTFSVRRGTDVLSLSVEMQPYRTLAPLYHGFDAVPTYIIVGGFVFVPFSVPLLEEYVDDVIAQRETISIPEAIAHKGVNDEKETEDEELVLLLRALAHEVNYGYSIGEAKLLDKFNGMEVKNIRDFVKAVLATEEEFLTFEFKKNKRIVLNTKECRAAEAEILQMHGIEFPLSANLRDLQGDVVPASKLSGPGPTTTTTSSSANSVVGGDAKGKSALGVSE